MLNKAILIEFMSAFYYNKAGKVLYTFNAS